MNAAHRQSMAAMLAVERAGLRTLNARIAGIVRQTSNLGSFMGAMQRADSDLQHFVAVDLLAIRTAARSASHIRLVAELEHIHAPAAVRKIGISQDDHTRAGDVARALATAILAGAATRARNGDSARTALRASAQAQAFRVRMDAATETAQAFNREREEETNDYAARRVDTSLLPLLLKRWDATMDKAKCAECRDLDGTTLPWGATWPSFNVPGDVHPNCRCVETVLVLPIRYQQAA